MLLRVQKETGILFITRRCRQAALACRRGVALQPPPLRQSVAARRLGWPSSRDEFALGMQLYPCLDQGTLDSWVHRVFSGSQGD